MSARCSIRQGQAAARHFLDRASQRRGAHVFCHLAAESNARLGPRAIRYDQPPRYSLHGRNLRLFPPVANPPSKQPLLTLLKQARAFGLGVVLATQNPVDLDYKGLANTGTWFIGRLQTERDKARVLEGLEGASASSGKKFDKQGMEQLLAGLGNRVFLMNNVHEDAPEVFRQDGRCPTFEGH